MEGGIRIGRHNHLLIYQSPNVLLAFAALIRCHKSAKRKISVFMLCLRKMSILFIVAESTASTESWNRSPQAQSYSEKYLDAFWFRPINF